MTRVLFQGDSITDAFRKPEEQNPAFQLGNGYVFLIAARLAASSPAEDLEFLNRGVSGNGLKELIARWEADALALNPDVLSLLIGVNEVLHRKDEATGRESRFARGYRRLLQSTRERNPDVQLIIMEPFLLKVGEVRDEWIDQITSQQKIIRTIAQEFGAALLPLQALFNDACRKASPAFWARDGIHPTHAGFELIAQAWIEAFDETRHARGIEDSSSKLGTKLTTRRIS